MSRRGYPTSEIYEDPERDHYHDRDYYQPRRTVYDDVEIRERRRALNREPDFLREDYGLRGAGPLVIRDDKRERSRERPRRREVETHEVVVAREHERPREHEATDREITYRHRERAGPVAVPVAVEREDYVYRRKPPAQQVRSEREEYVFRAPPKRESSPARAEITIKANERTRPIDREFRDEEITIERDERSRPRERGFMGEEIIIKRDERSRGPPRERDRGFDKEKIIIQDRERRRPRAASYERESLTISSEDRERPRAKSRDDFREEDQIIIRRDEGRPRARSRGVVLREEDITIRRGEREQLREKPRERSRERDYEDIIFRHDENKGRHEDQIIIRRNERSPSPEPIREPIREPEPVRELEPVRAPPIHQEIITHHRHIDHGFERAPEPPRLRTPPRARTPPRLRSPSPPPVRDERIEIHHSGTRNGQHYDDDIVFERETGARRALDGVRRSERHEEEEVRELAIIDTRDKGRRFEAEKSKKERMWTEITKDLVSEEAIKEVGYEYEETEEFYYVMEYLRYEDVLRLVELTDDIKRDRRERIREIQAERDYAERRRPLALPPSPPWDEERVVEREIIYERGPPQPRRHR